MGRTATIERNTKETQVYVALNLDGKAEGVLDTGVPFLDHMLEQVLRHARIDLTVKAQGDLHIDAHHTVEDIGITLGQAFCNAIGDKKGITRFAHAYVPLDESLSRVVIDVSGRPGLFYDVAFTRPIVGGFDLDLIREFYQGFVNHAAITLHITNLVGVNAHHQCESIFKAFGRALSIAVMQGGCETIPSTKGCL